MDQQTLVDQIQNDRKTAMKEKNLLGKEVLSYIRSQIKNKEIDTKETLTNDEVIAVIKKDIKSRNETLETLEDGSDEFQKQHDAITLLTWYLPEPLSRQEIIDWIRAYLQEHTPDNLNPHRGAIQSWLKGAFWARVDWKLVNEIIGEFMSWTIK